MIDIGAFAKNLRREKNERFKVRATMAANIIDVLQAFVADHPGTFETWHLGKRGADIIAILPVRAALAQHRLAKNPDRIWLAPACNIDERTWCEHDPGCCDECGEPSVEYRLVEKPHS